MRPEGQNQNQLLAVSWHRIRGLALGRYSFPRYSTWEILVSPGWGGLGMGAPFSLNDPKLASVPLWVPSPGSSPRKLGLCPGTSSAYWEFPDFPSLPASVSSQGMLSCQSRHRLEQYTNECRYRQISRGPEAACGDRTLSGLCSRPSVGPLTVHCNFPSLCPQLGKLRTSTCQALGKCQGRGGRQETVWLHPCFSIYCLCDPYQRPPPTLSL